MTDGRRGVTDEEPACEAVDGVGGEKEQQLSARR
jgi:hypothetical protein